MLVKFAIDPQALLKESNPLPLNFDRLVDRWENYGVLVNTDDIEDSLDSIEFNIRIQLEEIFKDDDPPRRFRFLKDTVSQVNWETLDDSNIGLLRDWADMLDLAVLNDDLAYFVGASDSPLSIDEQQAKCGNVEPIGFPIADQARAWRQASAISRRGFEVGEAHETLWSERFSRLVEFAGQIVVIDAYALHDRQIAGLLKLLEFIDRDGNACRVTLYSSPSEDVDEAVERIRGLLHEAVGRLDGGGVQQVTVRLLPIDEQEHDRRIRFDRTVFAPENSFALVFSGGEGTVPVSVGCSMQLSDDEYHPFDVMKQTENELLKKARALRWLSSEDDFIILHPNQRIV